MADVVSPEKPRLVLLRVLLAGFVGFAVMAIAVCAAWQEDLEYYLGGKQAFTRMDLYALEKEVTDYRSKVGTLPATLADLDGPKQSASQPARPFVDKWGHSLIYERTKDAFVIRSLGRDGKPGGVGLDYDLSTSDVKTRTAYPTLVQFLLDMPTEGITMSCVLSGLLAFGLTLFLVWGTKLTVPSLVFAVIKVGFTVFASIALAAAMAFHHVN